MPLLDRTLSCRTATLELNPSEKGVFRTSSTSSDLSAPVFNGGISSRNFTSLIYSMCPVQRDDYDYLSLHPQTYPKEISGLQSLMHEVNEALWVLLTRNLDTTASIFLHFFSFV